MSALYAVARRVARSYKRRVWWADEDDLLQEALMACLRAERAWRPEAGVSLEAFATVCARRACGMALLHETAPVSASWHKRSELVGLTRTQLDADRTVDSASVGRALAEDAAAPFPDVEGALDRKRLAERVRERAMRVLVACLGEETADAALRALLDENAPSNALGTRWRNDASRLLLRDLQCYHLWKESEALLQETQ